MKNIGIIALSDLEKTLALEEEQLGKTSIEDERCFYAKMEDAAILQKAVGRERQEQWELKQFADDHSTRVGRIRVRKVGASNPEYFITSKIPAERGEEETTDKISEDFFNAFKKMSSCGMIKTRYYFDVPGRPEKWEVDVFETNEGKICNYVKMDFEFAEGQPREVPGLPEGFSNPISAKTTDPQQKAFIQQLYDQVFRSNKEAGKDQVADVSFTRPECDERCADVHAITVSRGPDYIDYDVATEGFFGLFGQKKTQSDDPVEMAVHLTKLFGSNKPLRRNPGSRTSGPLAAFGGKDKLLVGMHSLSQAMKAAEKIEASQLKVFGKIHATLETFFDRWNKDQLLKDYSSYQRELQIVIPDGWRFEEYKHKGKATPHGDVVDPSGAYSFVWIMNGHMAGDPKVANGSQLLHMLSWYNFCEAFGRNHHDDHVGSFSIHADDAKRMIPDCLKLVQDASDFLGHQQGYFDKMHAYGDKLIDLANSNPNLLPRPVVEHFLERYYRGHSVLLQTSFQTLRLMRQLAQVIYE